MCCIEAPPDGPLIARRRILRHTPVLREREHPLAHGGGGLEEEIIKARDDELGFGPLR